MEKQFNWAIGKPGVEDPFFSIQAETEAYFGRLTKPENFSCAPAVPRAAMTPTETAALCQSFSALHDAEFGEFASAQQQADAALAIAKSMRYRNTLSPGLRAQRRCFTSAIALADQLNKDFPSIR